MTTQHAIPSASVQDHGLLLGLLDDDHPQYPLAIGRSGGQSLIGSPVTAEALTLQGSSGANVGFINANSPIIFGSYSSNPSAAYGFSYTATESFTAVFVGGGLNFSGNITFSNSTFIYESFRGSPAITTAAVPGFAAYTVLQALPLLNAGSVSTHNPLNSLIINCGPTMQNTFVGTRTAVTSFGLSFSPQTRATVFGAIMTVTNQTAVSCRPTFSTVSGSTVNLGTIRGLHQQNPSVALFQPQTGVENMTANIAVDVDNITVGGNVIKAAVRSAQAAASNAYFLLNNSTAQSEFGSSNIHFNDLFGPSFGTGSGDVTIGWASSFLFFNFITGNTGQLRISSEAAGNTTDRFLFQGSIQDVEMNFNCDRFSMGAQSGTVGNQVGTFVTPTRTTSINGSWADFLLTHAGNLTIDNTMSDVSAWVINPVSLTTGTGSITSFVAGLQIGMTTSSLGGADTMATRVNGRHHQRGVAEYPPLNPAQLIADVNDYVPATFNSMRQIWRLTSDASRTITGIAIQQGNDTQWVTNGGGFNIVLGHQDVLSAAANRIISPTGANVTLGPDESACLWYDNTDSRWRILWHTGV